MSHTGPHFFNIPIVPISFIVLNRCHLSPLPPSSLSPGKQTEGLKICGGVIGARWGSVDRGGPATLGVPVSILHPPSLKQLMFLLKTIILFGCLMTFSNYGSYSRLVQHYQCGLPFWGASTSQCWLPPQWIGGHQPISVEMLFFVTSKMIEL